MKKRGLEFKFYKLLKQECRPKLKESIASTRAEKFSSATSLKTWSRRCEKGCASTQKARHATQNIQIKEL